MDTTITLDAFLRACVRQMRRTEKELYLPLQQHVALELSSPEELEKILESRARLNSPEELFRLRSRLHYLAQSYLAVIVQYSNYSQQTYFQKEKDQKYSGIGLGVQQGLKLHSLQLQSLLVMSGMLAEICEFLVKGHEQKEVQD